MSLPDPYARHRDFVAPAGAGAPLWQVGAGLAVAEIVFLLSPLVLFPIFGDRLWEVLDGATAGTLFLALLLYALPALAIAQWVRGVHGRSAWSLIGPPLTALRDMRRAGIGVFFVLLAIELAPPFPNMEVIEETRPLVLWLMILPFGAFAILIQSGSEELIFRGYLQQQMAAVSDRPLMWMVLPSALFGYLHFGNADGAADGVLWAFWAFCLGMSCADLTARTGTIGAAVGLHTMNNIFDFCLFGMNEGPDSGFALFLYPFTAPTTGPGVEALASPWAAFDIIVSILFNLIMWLGARIALRR